MDHTTENELRHHTRKHADRATAAWYLRSLGRTPLLTPAEEKGLARRIQAGARRRGIATPRALDERNRARERFIRANVRLVWTLARKYAWVEGVEQPDLFQEGLTGLIEAVERFDPDKGTRFSTYATWWILKAIRRSIDNRSRLVRLPVHVLNRMRNLRKVLASLRVDLGGQEPTVADAAEAMEVDEPEVQFLMDLGHLPLSLDEPVPGEDDSRRGDLLTDTSSPSVEEIAERRRLVERLRCALRGLTVAERRLIERRYGLGRRRPETLQSIGKSLGVTRERARQIERLLIQALRESRPLRGAVMERAPASERLAG